MSTATLAVMMDEVRRWADIDRCRVIELGEKPDMGPLNYEDSQSDDDQGQEVFEDSEEYMHQYHLQKNHFTKPENGDLKRQITAENGHQNTNGDHGTKKLAEQAWQLLLEAVSDRDLDDAKQAVDSYVKAIPKTTYRDLEEAFRHQNVGIYIIALEKELAATYTNVDLQGNVDKKYSVSWRWSPKPMRPKEIALWPSSPEENLSRLSDAGEPNSRKVPKCTNCDTLGHSRKDCPAEEIKIERVTVMCFNCKEPGHRMRDCPQPRDDRFSCKNCKQPGHSARECPEPRSTEGIECKKCKELGHIARNCTLETVLICRNCDAVGHIAKECPLPRDYSRVKCNNCEKLGHTKVRCPEPIIEITENIRDDSNESNEKEEFHSIVDNSFDEKGWENNASAIGENSWDAPAVISQDNM